MNYKNYVNLLFIKYLKNRVLTTYKKWLISNKLKKQLNLTI